MWRDGYVSEEMARLSLTRQVALVATNALLSCELIAGIVSSVYPVSAQYFTTIIFDVDAMLLGLCLAALARVPDLCGIHIACIRHQCVHEFSPAYHLSWSM